MASFSRMIQYMQVSKYNTAYKYTFGEKFRILMMLNYTKVLTVSL